MDSPSGRVPERAPERFLVATEACGGRTPDLSYFLEVTVFIGFFGVGLMSGGFRAVHEAGGTPRWSGHVPHPRGQLGTLLAQLFHSRGFFRSTKNHQKLARQLDSVWYSFSVKLKNKEKTKTGTGL